EEKLEAAEDLEREDYLAIYYGISLEKANVLGEIYLQLLELHHEQAVEEGYDSYADYAYERIFVRDYDVDETKKMLREIRNKGARFITAVDLLSSDHPNDYGSVTGDDTETYEMLLPYMEDIDPEIGASLRHLLDCGLYDLDYDEKKVGSTGYTIGLTSYGDCFIFDQPYNAYNDLFTYVHEFGHYHHNTHDTAGFLDAVNNIDVDEIHSQGMEMLFTKYYPEIYGEEMGKDLEFLEVSGLVGAIPDIAVTAEFEIYAHEHAGKVTVEELNKEFLKLFGDYGYSFPDTWDQLPLWVNTPHLFTSPNYYISYLTSAMTSLEIYNLSHRDRKEAVEKYMELTAYPGSAAYSAVVEETGLSDIFDKGVSSEILRDTYRFLKYD
ncbi:MAG: hypothetical protein IK088_03815, partial [Lachnospiraceae bacterium]|nr:hypothetical protein [Lachnospiraceae bacterium]